MDISKKSILELKALAYDTLVTIDSLNKDLQVINAAMQTKMKEEQNKKEEPTDKVIHRSVNK